MKNLKFSLFVLFLGLFSCKNDLKDIKQTSQISEAGVERADSITLYYSDSAIVRMIITAPVMLYYLDTENPRRTFPKGIHVDFFDQNKQQTSQLDAKSAEQLERNQEIILRDSVTVWNIKDQRLQSNELICDERNGKIYSNQTVTITTPSYYMYGTGFRSNMDFTDWYLDTVQGTVQTTSDLDNPIY